MLLAGRVRGARAGRRRARPRARRPARAARGRRLAAAASSRAASSSASRSPARSSTTRRCCSPTSRPATSTWRPAPRCCGCCARGAEDGRAVVMVTHEAAAAAIADRVLRLRGRAARGVIALALAGAARAPLADAAGGRRGARGVAGRRHRRDGRLRARDRLRPRRDAGRPARRDRALRRRAARHVDARVRALPNLAARSYRCERQQRPASRRTATSRDRGALQLVPRRPPRLRDRRRPRPRAGPARSWSSRASRASGTCTSATRWTSGGSARSGSSASRSSPDNVAFPLAGAARVVRARPRSRRARPNLALLWLNDRVEGRRDADPGARGVVRPRPAAVRHARRACACCSRRRRGS